MNEMIDSREGFGSMEEMAYEFAAEQAEQQGSVCPKCGKVSETCDDGPCDECLAYLYDMMS